ncbi:MAG TPA: methyltransferase domain-containing protein [Azospirillaceae bacterium]|nr:methyltransferase domain-containing protein [Azospirillaceae bacterium]
MGTSPGTETSLLAPRPTEEGEVPSLTLRERFLIWWEGYDLEAIMERRRRIQAERDAAAGIGGAGAQGADGDHLNRNGKPLWTATRIGVVEKIWGDGFATPGGDEHIPTLVKPFGLNPAMSVLDIGAGLGGSTRAMAKQFGAWVTGLEGNPTLAEAGMFRSHKSGQARQAPVQLFEPEKFAWPKRVDCVFAKECFFTVRNKDGMIDGVERCMKPRGQLLFTDYVIDKAVPRGRNYDSWLSHEPVEPQPWEVGQYVSALEQRRLDIRIAEDISDMHKSLILNAIQGLVQHLEQHSMDNETKVAVVEEVELWARRVAALESGLRVYRFYAMKHAEVS